MQWNPFCKTCHSGMWQPRKWCMFKKKRVLKHTWCSDADSWDWFQDFVFALSLSLPLHSNTVLFHLLPKKYSYWHVVYNPEHRSFAGCFTAHMWCIWQQSQISHSLNMVCASCTKSQDKGFSAHCIYMPNQKALDFKFIFLCKITCISLL